MWILIRKSSVPERSQKKETKQGADLGTLIILFPFMLIWRLLKSWTGDVIGLVMLLFIGYYVARRYGYHVDPKKVVDYGKNNSHELLFYGGVVLGFVSMTLRFLWWMLTPSRSKPKKR